MSMTDTTGATEQLRRNQAVGEFWAILPASILTLNVLQNIRRETRIRK